MSSGGNTQFNKTITLATLIFMLSGLLAYGTQELYDNDAMIMSGWFMFTTVIVAFIAVCVFCSAFGDASKGGKNEN